MQRKAAVEKNESKQGVFMGKHLIRPECLRPETEMGHENGRKRKMSTLLDAALQYLEKGLSIIPVNPANKKSLIKWEKFQKRRPTEDEVKEWWTKWPKAMIAVVTGPISGIIGLDADSIEAEEEIESFLPETILTPIVDSPHGQHHWFQFMDGIRNYNGEGNPKFHVRGAGGYIIAPPSINKEGKAYSFRSGLGPADVAPAPLPHALLNKINIAVKGGYGGESENHKNTTGKTTGDHTKPQRPQNIFTEGSRNEDIFHHAYTLLKGGMRKDDVAQAIEFISQHCIPPYPQSEAMAAVESAFARFSRKKDDQDSSIADEIEAWVKTTEGNFKTTESHKELQITTKEGKKAAMMAFLRLKERGIIEKVGNAHGVYRRVDREIKRIDLKAPRMPRIDLKWPLGVEDYVYMIPHSLVAIAGETDGGKTAFSFDFAGRNLQKYKIHYFTTEMQQEGLQDRLSLYGQPMDFWDRLEIIERENGFEDIVSLFPDDIHIIDYLSAPIDKIWTIKEPIDRVFFKLNKGIAIINLQMGQGQSLPYGKTWGIERACLAITLKKNGKENVAEIIKAKNWVNPKVRPTGLKVPFWVIKGCRIEKKGEWE